MKRKFRMFLFICILTFASIINVNAETKIKEDTNEYTGDVYIIGSSKFDSDVIVTGTMASIAGARETYIQYMIHKNYSFRPEDLKIYYYSDLDQTWSLLPAKSGDVFRELSDEETKKLTENLKIYYVNEEEKVLEVPYNVVLEEGYELSFVTNIEEKNAEIIHENNTLKIPATLNWVQAFAVKGDDKVFLGAIEQKNSEFEVLSAVNTYEELKLAIDSGVKNIQLEANIDLPTALEITSEVAVELNGHNLTVTKDTVGDGVFHVVEGGDLTINGEGIIDGTGDNKWSMAIFAEAGKVTINGGTYTNKNIVIKENDTDSSHFDVIYAKGTAQVEINGGYFEGKTPAWLLNLHDGSRSTANIVVKGGTFVGFNPANNKAEGEGTNFVADGYKVSALNGEYTVSKIIEEDVVLVNGISYTSLQDAVTRAENGSVIEIVKDIDSPTAVSVAKKVIVELNGHNLTVTKDTAGDGVFHVVEGGDLTINGEGIIDGTGDNKWSMAIFAEAGKVTINGGTYTNKNIVIKENDTDSSHFDVIYAKGTAQVEINGGYFEGKTPAWLLNLHDGSRSTANIVVKGGTFAGFNPANNKAEGEGTNFVAEGYKVELENNEYTVVESEINDVVLVNGFAYTTLQEAFTNAESGSVVKIIKDIDSPTAVSVAKKVIVELNGHNLTVTKDTAGDGVFHVVEGGDLTINGEGIIDGTGDNKWSMAIFAEAGKVTINGGTYTNKNIVIKENDTDSSHFDVIYAKGTAQVEINGGYFEGKTPAWLLNLHDGSRSTANIVVKGGTFAGFNPANNKAEGEGTNFVAEGYKVELENNEYTVVKES